jgi:hypothetical protein
MNADGTFPAKLFKVLRLQGSKHCPDLVFPRSRYSERVAGDPIIQQTARNQKLSANR